MVEVEADEEEFVGEAEDEESTLFFFWKIRRIWIGLVIENTYGIVVIVPEDTGDIRGDSLVAR